MAQAAPTGRATPAPLTMTVAGRLSLAMMEVTGSPRILEHSWGQVRVEGARGGYKDAKLFPGGSREWDWRETGTSHLPGVQPEDLEELVEHGAEVIVLSTGRIGALRVPRETLDWLREQGVEIHVHRTGKAVDHYNDLAETRPTGALIHSTC